MKKDFGRRKIFQPNIENIKNIKISKMICLYIILEIYYINELEINTN